MGISKYNAEHYSDPTAYAALSAVQKEEKAARAFRPLVYICSPYAGNIEANTANARRYSRFAVQQGYIPIAPHLLFTQFLDDKDSTERNLGMFFGNVIMSKCAEVWVFGNTISTGMSNEIDRAKHKGYIIRYFDDEIKEVQR